MILLFFYICMISEKKVNEILLTNKFKTFNSTLDLTLIHRIQRPIPKLELRIFDRNCLIGQKFRENEGFLL